MLILGGQDLERLLAPADVVAAMERTFRAYAAGACVLAPRSAVPTTADGTLLTMPAALTEAPGALGTKLVTVYTGNRARGRPTIHAAYVLMDLETGEPLALLEASFLTGLRTGATSALAARFLARRDSTVITCIGAGAQAGFQLLCLAAAFPVVRIMVVGRSRERADAFADRTAARLGLPVMVVPEVATAARQSDIIVCATTSISPVLRGRDVAPGTHIDAIGAFRADAREVDTEAVVRARVVVDTYEGARAEAGDVLIPIQEGAITWAHIVAELAEVVTQRKPGRTRPEEITLFKSVGFALEDAAVARLAYDRARAARLGTEVDLG